MSNGGEAALFGALAGAEIHDLVIDKPVIHVVSDNDATPYVAVVGGFDLGSSHTNITVNEPQITMKVSDTAIDSRPSAWASVSGLVAGGWSNTVKNCSVNGGSITLDAESVKVHGGEYYVGGIMGECYSFMYDNTATVTITVNAEDKSKAAADTDMLVYVGGAGGTNTTQQGSKINAKINVSVKKPVGSSKVSIGGLTGSQRYQIAENNTINTEITTDCELDPTHGKLYTGKVIGSTNVPYCIVQMIFADPDSAVYSGCRNNNAAVTHNGAKVTVNKGEVLMVGGEVLSYIANGDITADGVAYASNIDEVIAEYGSAVPTSFLQKSVTVLIDE